MSLRNWDSEIARKEMARLLAPNVLGFYTHYEATAVFAFPPGQREPINVFLFLVAEERLPAASEEPHYLNPDRIVITSLKDWTFGIQRYVMPIAELVPAFDVLCESKTWCASGQPLQTADLVSIPTQFVPSDNLGPVPWNRVLKNNFWNGSHVFEWADTNKTALQPLFDNPPCLQELSEAVRSFFANRLGEPFRPAWEYCLAASHRHSNREIRGIEGFCRFHTIDCVASESHAATVTCFL
jgi:hypothetical protein